MDYQLQLASVPAPEADLDVFPFLNKLRQEAGEQPPSATLQRFHATLVKLFPDMPWSAGHYAGDVGRLTLVRRRDEVVAHVLHIAGELGLTVVDNQTGEVHRPPTYQVVLEGPADGVDPADAGSRLAALMRQPVAQMQALVAARRRTVVKKGVPRVQANQYIAALRERAGCHATLAPEPGPVARPAPPAPSPVPAAPKPDRSANATTPQQATAAPHGAGAATGGLLLVADDASTPASRQPDMPSLSRRAAAAEEDATEADVDAKLFLVAEGVRLICIAIGLNFLLRGAIRMMAPVPAAVSSGLLLAMTVYGCLRLTAGLGFSSAVRAAVVLAVISPVAMTFGAAVLPLPLPLILGCAVASLLLMLVLGVKGTRTLKQAGFKVGLFGAAKDDVRRLGGMAEGERLQSTALGWITFMVVFLAFMGGQATVPQQAPQLTSADVPCQFVGTWEVQKSGGVHQVTMADNGTYSATVVSGQAVGSFSEYAGNWRYNGSSLYWTDEAFTPVRKWVNNVATVGEEEFHAQEGSGPLLLFKLKQRGKSQRCNY